MIRRVFFLFLLLFSGCRVGPTYSRPCLDIPEDWISEVEEKKVPENLTWWEEFSDPVLDQLIVEGIDGNKDLQIASERILEFLARYRVVRADLFPQVYGTVSVFPQRLSKTLTPVTGLGNPFTTWSAFFSAAWDTDLFGRIRSASDAAYADYEASSYARDATVSMLVASISSLYIDLLRLDLQLKISIDTTESRKRTLDLFRSRFEAGVISKIELSQIESEYEGSKATIPLFLKLIAEEEYAIRQLLGQNPAPIPVRGKLADLTMPEIPEGLPSELLYRRPDIQQAEQLLIAANARIGVARAKYFPSIILTGQYGQASPELSTLFTGASNQWNYLVPIVEPIFTAGKIGAEVDVAESLARQALLNYERQIQTAFREVEDALTDYRRTKEQLESERLRVKALLTYAHLAKMRYDEGYASYLEVLDAERSLFDAELRTSDTESNLYIAMIKIYRSLGGDWIYTISDQINYCYN